MEKRLFVIIPILIILIGGAWFIRTSEEAEAPTVNTTSTGGEIATFDINDPDVSRFVATSDKKENIMNNNTTPADAPASPGNVDADVSANEDNRQSVDLANVTQATFKTNMGDITVEFYREDSPKTVENFVKLASTGFYDGVKFHRVIKDFMIQSGDPLSKDDNMKARWGTGGPGYAFADEFNNRPLVQGSLAMANAGPDTNGSQFFIVTAQSTPWLDGKHTNFGMVINGLDVVMAIQEVPTEGPDRPVDPVIIESVELR